MVEVSVCLNLGVELSFGEHDNFLDAEKSTSFNNHHALRMHYSLHTVFSEFCIESNSKFKMVLFNGLF